MPLRSRERDEVCREPPRGSCVGPLRETTNVVNVGNVPSGHRSSSNRRLQPISASLYWLLGPFRASTRKNSRLVVPTQPVHDGRADHAGIHPPTKSPGVQAGSARPQGNVHAHSNAGPRQIRPRHRDHAARKSGSRQAQDVVSARRVRKRDSECQPAAGRERISSRVGTFSGIRIL
jgi:hypothetical protein